MSKNIKKIIVAFLLLQIVALPLLYIMDNVHAQRGLLVLAALAVLVTILVRTHAINVVRTMGNEAVAKFTRTVNPDRSITFDIQPARVSRLSLALFGGATLVVMILMAMVPWLFPLWLLMGYFLMQTPLKDARYRKNARLTVTEGQLRNDENAYGLDDIADIRIDKALHIVDEPVAVGPGGQSTSGMIGRATGRRQAERTYMLKLRARGGSEETVLCGGLTLPCAEALLSDLNTDMTMRAAA